MSRNDPPENPIPTVPALLDGAIAFANLDHYRMRRRISSPIRAAHIPELMTAKALGDARGYVSPCREYAYGFHPDSSEWVQDQVSQLRLTGFMPYGRGHILTRLPSYLGASVKLDHPGHRDFNDRRIWHRPSVRYAGGGDYFITDTDSGCDVIVARCAEPHHLVIFGRWHGVDRFWIGFAYCVPEAGKPELEWSGLAAYEGFWLDQFVKQLWPGEMPPRVFIEALLEQVKLPRGLAEVAYRCGFQPERN